MSVPIVLENAEAESSEQLSAVPAPEKPILKSEHHTCCQGVDVPGVGHTHSPECPAMARRAKLPEPLRSFVTDEAAFIAARQIAQETRELIAEIHDKMSGMEARRDRRETLLAELIFASRALAQRNIQRGLSARFADPLGPELTSCAECLMVEHQGRLPHTATCRTGRVLRIQADLIDTLYTHFTGKEHAPEGEKVCAGDGIRLRGLTDLVCLKCGARGGPDWKWEPCLNEANLELLGLNQVAKKAGLTDFAIYTHLCNGGVQ